MTLSNLGQLKPMDGHLINNHKDQF